MSNRLEQIGQGTVVIYDALDRLIRLNVTDARSETKYRCIQRVEYRGQSVLLSQVGNARGRGSETSVATVKTSTFEKCVITGAINYVTL